MDDFIKIDMVDDTFQNAQYFTDCRQQPFIELVFDIILDQAKNLGINVSLQEKHLELGYRISPLFIARRHISIF